MNGMTNQLVNTLVLSSGNRHYWYPQHFFQGVNTDTATIRANLIHHIQGQHHRNIQLHQLHGKTKIPLQIGSIHNINNACRLFLQKKFSGNNFLAGIRRQGINPRQIRYHCLWMVTDSTILSIHRYPGKITYMLIGSCELIKKGGFTTVLIASQSKGNLLALGQYRSLGMSLIALCLSQLTHTRMGHRFITNRLHFVHQLPLMDIFYFYQGCLSKAQG